MFRWVVIDTFATEDLTAPEVLDDPHRYFGRLRETDPVHWNPVAEAWIVTRYRDISALLRDHERFSSAVQVRDWRATYPPIDPIDADLDRSMKSFWGEALIAQDRPPHLEMRRSIHAWFTPTAVEVWRPRVRETVRRLLDEQMPAGAMDVKADFAAPLPLLTICVMLGVPEADANHLRDLALNVTGAGFGPRRMGSLIDGIRELEEYFAPVIEDRVRHPREDLVTLLADGERRGAFTRRQLVASVSLLMIAGHHTTHNLICNGVLAFIRHTGQWDLLRSDPERLAPSAVEECLRYDAPIKALPRATAVGLELGGKSIAPNDRIQWIITAGNRDPESFESPDEFDITRSPNRHLGFGVGIHHCLGASLARLEAQEALKALAERIRRFKLEVDAIEYESNLIHRSVQALAVSWDGKA